MPHAIYTKPTHLEKSKSRSNKAYQWQKKYKEKKFSNNCNGLNIPKVNYKSKKVSFNQLGSQESPQELKLQDMHRQKEETTTKVHW